MAARLASERARVKFVVVMIRSPQLCGPCTADKENKIFQTFVRLASF
jgi:hypothetical protein